MMLPHPAALGRFGTGRLAGETLNCSFGRVAESGNREENGEALSLDLHERPLGFTKDEDPSTASEVVAR